MKNRAFTKSHRRQIDGVCIICRNYYKYCHEINHQKHEDAKFFIIFQKTPG